MNPPSLLLPLLVACSGGDPSEVRHGAADDGDDSAAPDSGAPDEICGDTGSSDETTGCTTLGDARARCALASAGDWSSGSLEGLAADDMLTLGADTSSGTDTSGVYNGGSYVYGTFTSEVLSPGIEFDGLIPSWNADTPAGTWVAIQVRARVDGAWTAWYRLGVWASDDGTVQRHSFDGEGDADGDVWTDTLYLEQTADAAQIRATLFSEDGVETPTLRRLAIAVADTGAGTGTDGGGLAWGTTLDVPARSQMEFDAGEAWCSPTSTSMILAWWGQELGDDSLVVTVPEAADGTWDHTYEGNGNWPFNTAYAGIFGLSAEVGWFDSIDDIEPWIAAGVPVAISAAWDPGELDGAPISSTAGHLLVVTGFTASGDVTVNDPAADRDEEVSRTYDRRQIEAAWMGGSGGVVYLIGDELP